MCFVDTTCQMIVVGPAEEGSEEEDLSVAALMAVTSMAPHLEDDLRETEKKSRPRTKAGALATPGQTAIPRFTSICFSGSCGDRFSEGGPAESPVGHELVRKQLLQPIHQTFRSVPLHFDHQLRATHGTQLDHVHDRLRVRDL